MKFALASATQFLFLLIASCSFAHYASAQSQAMPKNYQGLLWEIKGNGLKKPSYLYGTMHVSNKLAFNLPDSFFVAVRSTEEVALELDMDAWMADIMLLQEAENNQHSVSYSDDYTKGFYRKAFSLEIPDEQDFKRLLQFSSNLSNRLMYRNSRQNSDYEEDNYLDVFIFQVGKKLNKKITGLEDLRKTKELARKAELDEPEDDVDEEEAEEYKEQKRLRLKELRGDKSYYSAVEDAYRKGNLDLLDSLGKLSGSEGMLKYMLYERNVIMADRMDSIMHKTSLFTGVGAAHLPGYMGVIELLRRKGYTVRAVNTSHSDIKTKNDIDEMRFPTQFTTHYSPDSVFSVSVPGKLYEMTDRSSFRYYLYNDMGNGSYYCVQRINHYGLLRNQTQGYILSRIDSLIFENIPGKLLSKKPIKSSNGFPGIEIVNKTSKGDIQKHMIYITPHEIYSFKMSGTQEYVKKGEEANLFFSSIRFYEQPTKEIPYRSKYGYNITIPTVKTIQQTSSAISFQHEVINATNASGTDYILSIASSLYDFEYVEVDTFELNMLAERFSTEAVKKITSKKHFTKNGNPALWFNMQNEDKSGKKFTAEIVINGPDYYLLCSNSDSLKAAEYFNSFAVSKKKYTVPFKAITDTALFFSADVQTIPNQYSDLVNQQERNYYEARPDKEEIAAMEYLPVEESKLYHSPETGEKVAVEYMKFSRYFHQKSMNAFWESRVEDLTREGTFKVRKISSGSNAKQNDYSLMLTDTGSARGIYVKFIQRCGALYTLKSVVDTAQGLTGFALSFFETFTPKDTCFGMEITADKLDPYFFAKLYDTDTTESKKAKEAIKYVQWNMADENVPSLIKTISNPDFNKLLMEHKTELIYCFSSTESKDVIPFLENLYVTYSDSVEIELAVLNTLAAFQTPSATKSFLRLLKIDIPVTSNQYSIASLISSFADSLKNAQLLFPELLNYSKYPEYKNSIYGLMAQVHVGGFQKPKEYKKLVNDILLDANYELKKYISEQGKGESEYDDGRYEENSIFPGGGQENIYNYATLLAPFYAQSNVTKFFNKLIASTSNEKVKALIYGQLIANNIELPDTVLKNFAASVSARELFYFLLKQQDKLNLFDKDYLNQKDLVIAQLYGDAENFPNDTIVLLAVHRVDFDKNSGNVYVFKTRPKDKKIWKLGYSAVQPANDKALLNENPQFTKTGFSFESEAQLQKEINMLMNKIRIENRNRATIQDFNTRNGSGNYFNY